jgi:hypothetical protein
MIDTIKQLLLKIIGEIDAGNSNITDEDAFKITKMLQKYTRKDVPMSKYQAYTYLNISRAMFDILVKQGKLPAGDKVEGFKELFWYKKDLDKYTRKNG